jgi:hypothetical protein
MGKKRECRWKSWNTTSSKLYQKRFTKCNSKCLMVVLMALFPSHVQYSVLLWNFLMLTCSMEQTLDIIDQCTRQESHGHVIDRLSSDTSLLMPV